MLYSHRETIFMNTGFQKNSGLEVATKKYTSIDFKFCNSSFLVDN
jgi:hypothetical protein